MRRLAALVAVLVAGCARIAAEPDALSRVKARGVLRWGGDLAGGEPYVYEDPERKGHLIGFEVELAEAIARELGVRAEFQQSEWSQLVPALERGTFDMIFNGLEIAPRTAARVAFSRPYFVFAERLVVRRDDGRFKRGEGAAEGPSALARLAGLRVGTLASSLASDILAHRTGAEVVLYDGVDTPYLDLVHGRLDAVLLDDVEADRYGAVHAELVSAGDLSPGYYAAGLRPADRALRAAVDSALDRVARSGELQRILARAKLWSEREEPLVAWSADRAAALARELSAAAPADVARLSLRDLPLFFEGALFTLLVSVLAMALAIPLGILLALGRTYGAPAIAALSSLYVEVYRGTPVLLQLYVLYFGLADVVRFGPLVAAVLGLGMNYAAYEAEVYRAGMQAVPRGQLEAAAALGLSLPQSLRRILLPQALRLALPNVTNDFIALLKDSSLVSVITVVELTKRTQIAAIETRSWLLPGFLCASLYFAMSYPLSFLARRLEKRLAGAGSAA